MGDAAFGPAPAHAPGQHLLIDAWGITAIDDPTALETAMRSAATAAGATVLRAVFHGFPGRGGVTGVLVLAESHISVHTWPEDGYAAFDIFVCGAVDATAGAEALRAALDPTEWQVTAVTRGVAHSNQRAHPAS